MGHSRTYLLRGQGTGVTTSATGTTNTLAKFTGASTIGDSLLSESGGTTVIQKNGNTAQEFRVYGNSTNFIDMFHTGSQGAIGNFNDGQLLIFINNTARWIVDSSGGSYTISPNSDNLQDFGTTTGRVRSGYFGGLSIKEGANSTMGVVTLSGAGGSAIVYTTKLVAGSRIFITEQNSGGTPGVVRVTSSTNLVSFTITSSSITDTSVVAWWLVVPS